jgi:hypothetical protein
MSVIVVNDVSHPVPVNVATGTVVLDVPPLVSVSNPITSPLPMTSFEPGGAVMLSGQIVQNGTYSNVIASNLTNTTSHPLNVHWTAITVGLRVRSDVSGPSSGSGPHLIVSFTNGGIGLFNKQLTFAVPYYGGDGNLTISLVLGFGQ